MNKINKPIVATFLIIIIFFGVNAFAGTITLILKSGEKVSGIAIEGNQEYIKILVDGKPRIVSINEIDRIEDPSEKLPEPMNGITAKTPMQEKANQDLISASIKEYGNKEKASEAVVEFGWQYYNSGDSLTAMKRFNQAWLLNSTNADVYWGFGLVLLDKGNLDRAIEMFNKSINLNPKNKSVYLNRAHAHGGKRNFSKAIEDYTKAIEIDPKDAQFYNDRGAAYFHFGQYEKSWQDIQKALDMGYDVHPGFLAALKSKGYSK